MPAMSADMAHEMGHDGIDLQAMVREMRNRFWICLVFTVPIFLYAPMGGMFKPPAPPFGLELNLWLFYFSSAAVVYPSWPFFVSAWRAVKKGTLGMAALIVLSVGTGYLFSVGTTFFFKGGGQFFEAVSVLLVFILLGYWLERRGRAGASSAVPALMNLTPAKANVIRKGAEVEVPTAAVLAGEIVVIRSGNKIPVDGTMETGESLADESMLTGESMTVQKGPGATVVGATMNKSGSFRYKATKVGADSALAQIVKLVQQTQNSKAPAQLLADKAAQWRAVKLNIVAATGFESLDGMGAQAETAGGTVFLGNRLLMDTHKLALGSLEAAATRLQGDGRRVVHVAQAGRIIGLVAIADAIRPTAKAAVAKLRGQKIEVVMLTGDNAATAKRSAADIGIETVLADVLPAQKAAKVKELQATGKKVGMVGDGVNDAPALLQANVGFAIGAGTDGATDRADIMLMKSDRYDIVGAIELSRATLRKMHQNLWWAVDYNTIAFPLAAGVLFPFVLSPEVAAMSMSGSTLIVAINAQMLTRTKLAGIRQPGKAAALGASGEQAALTPVPVSWVPGKVQQAQTERS